MSIRKIAAVCVLGAALISTGASGAISNQQRGSLGGVLPELADSDKALLVMTARERMTDQPVGTSLRWENEETGNFGYVILLNRFEKVLDGTEYSCRQVLHAIKQQGTAGMFTYAVNLCQNPDGEWKWLN